MPQASRASEGHVEDICVGYAHWSGKALAQPRFLTSAHDRHRDLNMPDRISESFERITRCKWWVAGNRENPTGCSEASDHMEGCDKGTASPHTLHRKTCKEGLRFTERERARRTESQK